MLTLNQMSKEAREIMAGLVISRDERAALIKRIADGLTYEETQELMLGVLEEYDYKSQSGLDNMLWLTRAAYIYGFTRGIDMYSTAIEMELRNEEEADHE